MSRDTRLPLSIPAWPAPKHIRAYTTLRSPGESVNHYSAYNLATHVGDHHEHVVQNRYHLAQYANLPNDPIWLNQTHSSIAIDLDNITRDSIMTADASHTRKINTICAVMTADCLPMLVTNEEGTEVAAIHAGWQGLSKGVIENTLSVLTSAPESLLIWLGPSIQKENYEVGEEVYHAFLEEHDLSEIDAAFTKRADNKWHADIPLLAVQRLIRYGVKKTHIYLSQQCTYAHSQDYFSFRRDGITGRMASLIFIAPVLRF